MDYKKEDFDIIIETLKKEYSTASRVLDKLYWSDSEVNSQEDKLSKSAVALEQFKDAINVHINRLYQAQEKDLPYPDALAPKSDS
jgi:hypothetical protein